jgi:hypothetical protein
LQMLNSWNIDIYLPEKLPVDIAYELLIGTLEKEVFITNDEYSHIGIELCSYDVETCPFGTDYCTCKENIQIWENEAKSNDDLEINDDELPF